MFLQELLSSHCLLHLGAAAQKGEGKKKEIFSFKQEGRVATKTSCIMQDIDTHDFWIICILYCSETRDCCKKDKRTYRQAESS